MSQRFCGTAWVIWLSSAASLSLAADPRPLQLRSHSPVRLEQRIEPVVETGIQPASLDNPTDLTSSDAAPSPPRLFGLPFPQARYLFRREVSTESDTRQTALEQEPTPAGIAPVPPVPAPTFDQHAAPPIPPAATIPGLIPPNSSAPVTIEEIPSSIPVTCEGTVVEPQSGKTSSIIRMGWITRWWSKQ